MFFGKIHEQTILEISQGDHIEVTADSFLIDRQARELSRHTIKFYREFLRTFIEYCNANSLIFIQQIAPDFLRRYFLAFGEKHNAGGVPLCVYNGGTTPLHNLECKAEENMVCLRIQMVL